MKKLAVLGCLTLSLSPANTTSLPEPGTRLERQMEWALELRPSVAEAALDGEDWEPPALLSDRLRLVWQQRCIDLRPAPTEQPRTHWLRSLEDFTLHYSGREEGEDFDQHFRPDWKAKTLRFESDAKHAQWVEDAGHPEHAKLFAEDLDLRSLLPAAPWTPGLEWQLSSEQVTSLLVPGWKLDAQLSFDEFWGEDSDAVDVYTQLRAEELLSQAAPWIAQAFQGGKLQGKYLGERQIDGVLCDQFQIELEARAVGDLPGLPSAAQGKALWNASGSGRLQLEWNRAGRHLHQARLEWNGQLGVEIDVQLGSGAQALPFKAKSSASCALSWQQSARAAALK